MGRRGVIYHVRGKHPAKAFERLGKRCAVLASNRSWTSFVPLGRLPSGEAMSYALGAPVLAISSEDDHGTNLDFFTPDGWNAQLPISLRHEPLGTSDRDLLRQLVKTGFLSRDRVAKLALHIHYWSDLFQMNSWKLCNLYKKHLPAERQREVDELCNHVALGEEAKLCRGVETILSTVWDATDSDAASRDPELVRWEPLSDAQLADWRRRLAS